MAGIDTTALRERVEAIPGLARVLPALEGLPAAYLVGGAVRDLLRGERPVDLDVAVEGDAAAAARELAARLDGDAVEHERFGTATVSTAGLALDLASTRRERYVNPGALPEVEAAGLSEDLVRRDFTVNAMALGLSGAQLGVLHDPSGGLADLRAGLIRVLHPRSFADDPTRLLRAVRYESRLGFRMDEQTERLARAAAEGDGLRVVSGKRVGDELMDLLAEPTAPASAARLAQLGLDRALHPALRCDPDLLASAQLASAETGADPALAALAALASGDAGATTAWVDDLQLGRERRDAALRAARRAPEIARSVSAEMRPSELREQLGGEPPEALALALGLGAPGVPVLRWSGELRHVRLTIDGDDLRAAGVPESPALGAALEETLRRKLDGEVDGREAELSTALALAHAGEPG